MDSCFGFSTAVAEAQKFLTAAAAEARSQQHGVGVVKLMGRQSGFIAAAASAASGEVDLCLTPEVPFCPRKASAYVLDVVRSKGHAVVVVAEGAGQEAMRAERRAPSLAMERDASGNPILLDAGRWVVDAIKTQAKAQGEEVEIKVRAP